MKNSIYNLYPEFVKYFVNEEDSKNISIASGKRVQLKCPECGTLKNKLIDVYGLKARGFYCDFCSDKTSIPEKFMGNLLNYIGLDFMTQYSPCWACRKEYDFYIPSLNMIIETHGRQHYEETHRFRKLEIEIENDILKFEMALLNNIDLENYVIIDCRKSDLNFLKSNCIKSLYMMDLCSVDWDILWNNTTANTVKRKNIIKDKKSCRFKYNENKHIEKYNIILNAWNNGMSNSTINSISKTLGIDWYIVDGCIKNGIKKGEITLGERKISEDQTRFLKKKKQVYQFEVSGEFITSFHSMTDASNILNIAQGGISQCCSYKTKTSGGFKWSFNPPNEHNMYPD